jgi:hypothetical protein
MHNTGGDAQHGAKALQTIEDIKAQEHPGQAQQQTRLRGPAAQLLEMEAQQTRT